MAIYVPDEEYIDYGYCKRFLQLIIPYKRTWEGNEKYPIILFVPGSAWFRQEMYNNIPKRSELAKLGFIIAEVQYRESEINKFPAQIEDLRNAIKYIFTVSDKFHIDADNIFLAGDSSGGHISLITGLSLENNDFQFEDDLHVLNNIKGIIGISSPTNMFIERGDVPVRELLGTDNVHNAAELAESASCKKYIKKESRIPPILLIHGNADTLVSIENSKDLYNLLNKHNKYVEFYEIENEGHGARVFGERK